MKTMTISQAKTHLSSLVRYAEEGGQVLIMRGSKPAVALTPVTEDDLALWPEVPLKALTQFEAEIALERKTGKMRKIGRSPVEAARRLAHS